MRLPLACLLLAAALLTATGCRRGHDHDHAAATATAAATGGHAHAAPNGGVLVELGDHAHNVELVTRPGGFDLYLLDAHASNFIRVAEPALAANAFVAGRVVPLAFVAQANPASGETVGQTSHFAAAWPEAVAPERIQLARVSLNGVVYRNIDITPGTVTRPATSDAR